MRYQVRQQFRDLLDAICFNIHTDNEFSENSHPHQTHSFPEFANHEFTSPNPQINKNLQIIKSSLIFKHKTSCSSIPSTLDVIHKIIGIFEEIKLSFLTKHKNDNKNSSKKLDTSELSTYLPAYLTILNLAADIKFSEKSYNLALDYTRLIDDIFWPWDRRSLLFLKIKQKRARIFEELKQFESATLIHRELWKISSEVVVDGQNGQNVEGSDYQKIDKILVPQSSLYLLTNPNFRENNRNINFPENLKTLQIFFSGYISFTELEYSDSLSKLIQLSGITSLQNQLLPVLAELSFLAGRKLEAIEWFKKMRKLCPTELSNLDIYALLLYELSQLDRLEVLAVELNNLNNSESIPYWTTMGFIATIKEKHRQAIFCGSKINQLDPMNVQAYLLKGINLESIRRFDEAIKNFQEVIQNQPYRHDGYACIVHCLIQENKLSDALRIASEAVKQLTWKNLEAIVLYMIALFENSKLDKSMTSYCEDVAIRALKLNPFHENVIKVLASLYFQAEKYEKVVNLIGSRKGKMDMGEALLRTFNDAKVKFEENRVLQNRENIEEKLSEDKFEFKTPSVLTRAQARMSKGNNNSSMMFTPGQAGGDARE